LRIQKIIEDLHYKPNLLARSLASKRNYRIVTLLPKNKNNKGYWKAPIAGIVKAKKEIADYNVHVSNLLFDPFKVDTFRQKIKELENSKPDAVLVAPIFKKETIELTRSLDNQKIPYVFIDSNVEELNNLSYFGQNSYQSGFLAARLLETGLPENSKIVIINPSGSNISNQSLSRAIGFNAFFNDKNLKSRYKFISIDYNLNDKVEREKQLQSVINKKAAVAAAVVFNSRVYEIAEFIEKQGLQNIRLIGYDLLAENADFLRKGVVSFLIAQRPEEQGYKGVMTLFNNLVLKQPAAKVQYMPIDILTKENLDFYIDFNKHNI
jgi:LacI family transcriptional regulator